MSHSEEKKNNLSSRVSCALCYVLHNQSPGSLLILSHQLHALVCTEAEWHLLLMVCFLANALGSNILCLSSSEQGCLFPPLHFQWHSSGPITFTR